MNKRTFNAEMLLFSDDAWEHLGGISTLRETSGTSFVYVFS